MAQGSSSGTSSRRHGRNDHDTASISSSRYADADWEAKEAMRQRELEEARARATQMEKTMRWWSDCTANWRDKWGKVRNERNKAREESKLLRTQLDAAMKDINSFKREKMELESQNDQLKKEVEKIHLLLLKHAGQWDQQLLDALQSEDPEKDLNPINDLDIHSEIAPNSPRNSALLELAEPGSGSSVDQFSVNELLETRPERDQDDRENVQTTHDKDSFIEEYVLQGAVPRHAVELYNNAKENAVDKDLDGLEHFNHDELSSLLTCSEAQERLSDSKVPRNNLCGDTLSVDRRFSQNLDTDSTSDQEFLLQKLSILQLRLEEASKTILAEREEKNGLHKGMERLQLELSEAKGRCEELCISRQEVVRELLQLRENDPESDSLCDQLPSLAAALQELQEETSPHCGTERRLAELRTELERLQAENASEWGRRERLESEKQALERDNKKLRAEVRDLQERLERRSRPSSQTDIDTRQIQQLAQELADRTKELADVKHSHNKLKKVLQDKSTELAHAVRRAEQYEAEVKRLRGRVEELKRELTIAEDEVDTATNNIRKLQRTNEELQEQVESLQLQVEHLHPRLRMSNAAPRVPPRAPVMHNRDGSDGDVDDY